MEELGLPHRLFESGYEPPGRHRVNSYFKLRWIDTIKNALEDSDLETLMNSQFGRIMQMGNHTFSVMFLHFLLSRQLVTEKDFELWWILVGKPVRYAIQDFAFVTGLNCGESGGTQPESSQRSKVRGKSTGKGKASSSASIWEELFKGEKKPTVVSIMDRLVKGKRYKDRLTRLRLSLLVLVEGIICPTCGTTNIRPEVVRRLGDIEEFLMYPWGRESFILTVSSAKARTPENYIQETMALQGFSHAMILVAVAACPSLIVKPGVEDPLADDSLSMAEVVAHIIDRKLNVNHITAGRVDEIGLANVTSYICDDPDAELLSKALGDNDDASVNNLVSLIAEDYPFEHNLFSGGLRAENIAPKKPPTPSPVSSEDNVSEGGCKDKDTSEVPMKEVKSKERGGATSKIRESVETLDEENLRMDVPTLLRRAADAYEEKVLPMFEGYILSLKGHFHTEVGVLRTELNNVTDSVRDLNSKLEAEFEKIRTLIKGPGYFEDDQTMGGTSPYRQTSPTPNRRHDLPPPFVPPADTTPLYPAPGVGQSSRGDDDPGSPRDSIPQHSDPQIPFVETSSVATDAVKDSTVHSDDSNVLH